MLQVFCRYSVMSLCASRCLADWYWSISKIWSPSGSWKISRSNAWLEDDSDIVFLQIFKLTSQAISWRVDLGRFWMKAVTVGCDRGKLGQRKPCRAGVTVLIHWFSSAFSGHLSACSCHVYCKKGALNGADAARTCPARGLQGALSLFSLVMPSSAALIKEPPSDWMITDQRACRAVEDMETVAGPLSLRDHRIQNIRALPKSRWLCASGAHLRMNQLQSSCP